LARATIGICERKNPHHAADKHGYWTKTLEHYTGYSMEDLKDPVSRIHKYQLMAGTYEHMKGTYTAFSEKDRRFASLKAARCFEDLGFSGDRNHEDVLKDVLHELEES
jgi:hypothetical protein